jgi:hypothetical protein
MKLTKELIDEACNYKINNLIWDIGEDKVSWEICANIEDSTKDRIYEFFEKEYNYIEFIIFEENEVFYTDNFDLMQIINNDNYEPTPNVISEIESSILNIFLI